MKALNWKEGCKLLSELVILVIETFQGQIGHAAPLREELFERNDCQFLQGTSLKYGLKGKGNPPYPRWGLMAVINNQVLGGSLKLT